jgi:hypothetical protein
MALKICHLKAVGTTGLKTPLEVSTSISLSPTVTVITLNA